MKEKKRPSFHISDDSSDDENTSSTVLQPSPSLYSQQRQRQPARRQLSLAHSPAIVTAAWLVKYAKESLHSFSFVYNPHNSVSARVQMLKRSLTYLRDNPAALRELQRSGASLMDWAANGGNTASIHAVSEVSSSAAAARPSLVRSAASSATLSMLVHLTSAKKRVVSSDNSAESAQSQKFRELQEQVKTILDLLNTVPGSKHELPDRHASPRHGQRTAEKVGSSAVRGNSRSQSRSASNPPIILRPNEFAPPATASSPKPPAAEAAAHLSANENLRASILDAMASPYIDNAWPSSMHRISALSSVPAILNRSLSSLSLAGTGAAGGKRSPAHMNIMARTQNATTQAIFSTSLQAPFQIMSSNDIACLILGMSQSTMRSSSLLDFVKEPFKTLFTEIFTDTADDKDCVLCGEVTEICKPNGHESVASVWAKRSCDSIIWMVEEVSVDKTPLSIDASSNEIKNTDNGALIEFADEARGALFSRGISYQTLPVCKTVDYGADESIRIPCFAVRDATNPDKATSIFLPHISGLVVVEYPSLNVLSANKSFASHLFGVTDHQNSLMEGAHVDTFLVSFSQHLKEVFNFCHMDTENLVPGTVVPEQMFRKVAAVPPGEETAFSDADFGKDSPPVVFAVHVDGSVFAVDIQLRIVAPSLLTLWVSYNRSSQVTPLPDIPNQLDLKRKHSHTSSSTSSVERSGSQKVHSASSSGASSTASSPVTPRTSVSSLSEIANGRSLQSPLTPVTAASRQTATLLGARRREKKISDFCILEDLGEGAYGKVLVARTKDEPSEVVVIKSVYKKRILIDTWTRDRRLGSIPNEIKVMSVLTIDYPQRNIVQILDFFEDDEYFHIEMEKVGDPGIDLFDLIEVKPTMGELEVRTIFKQVVDAVAHLHSHGIVHRDIKDENIIINEQNGDVKLIDFGSAAFSRMGPFDMFVGTMDYAAPEVLLGNPYDGRPQDVWALGILLYTMVYKENPFYNVDEITNGKLEFAETVFSSLCLDLIRAILVEDAPRRPTIEDITEHEWFKLSIQEQGVA